MWRQEHKGNRPLFPCKGGKKAHASGLKILTIISFLLLSIILYHNAESLFFSISLVFRLLTFVKIMTKSKIVFGYYRDGAKLSVYQTTRAGASRSLRPGQALRALHHWGRAGDALDDSGSWCATNGIKDVQRVRKSTLHAVFHRTNLK